MTRVEAKPSAAVPRSGVREYIVWLCAAVYLLGFLPLTVAYYVRLWSLGHYQFFPLAFLGAAVLAARERGGPPLDAGTARQWMRIVLTGFSLLLLAGAIVIDSPWFGCWGALVATAALLYGIGGASAWRRYFPAWLMLLTTLRLPLGADSYLITALQRLTARFASEILDLFHIVHYLAGNVIVVSGRKLLVEEACSGVNSLFSALCGTVFFLLWERRKWLFSLFLLAAVPFWVVVANTTRVTVVAILRTQYEIAADEGRLHDALGLAVFALAMLAIGSTERLLYFYSAVMNEDAPADGARTKETSASVSREWRTVTRPAYGFAALASLVLLLLQIPTVAGRWREAGLERGSVALAEIGADFLPLPDAAWKRTGFELVRRDRGSAFGERSQAWTFSRDDAQAVVSLDYPFLGWHELTECYEMQGWTVRSRRIDEGDPALVEILLEDARGHRHAVLLFGILDRDGRPVPPRRRGEVDELFDRVLGRLRAVVSGNAGAERTSEGLTFQAQLLFEAYHPLSDEEVAQGRRMLRDALRRLGDTWTTLHQANEHHQGTK